MGIYATTTSLQTLMIGTTFDTVTSALCSRLITHSENEINKYISKRYDVGSFNTTSTAVPPLITSLCETLTEGYMYQRMSRGGKDGMARGKVYIDQVKENLKLLSEYKLDLIDSSGDVVTDMSQTSYRVLSNTTDYTNTFNEDDELNWKVDQNKLDDIADERDL
jgi:hypothetical protein